MLRGKDPSGKTLRGSHPCGGKRRKAEMMTLQSSDEVQDALARHALTDDTPADRVLIKSAYGGRELQRMDYERDERIRLNATEAA